MSDSLKNVLSVLQASGLVRGTYISIAHIHNGEQVLFMDDLWNVLDEVIQARKQVKKRRARLLKW